MNKKNETLNNSKPMAYDALLGVVVMKDMYGNDIKIGDKIKAIVRGQTNNHILNCYPNFKIDLSEPVTIRKDERGVLMAGQISLKSYNNRLVELVR